MQSLLLLSILLLWCSFIVGEQRILSPVSDDLHTQSLLLKSETDDPNLVDVSTDRQHHPVHPNPHHPHPNPKKYHPHPHHPHHPQPHHPHPHGSNKHHPHDNESPEVLDYTSPLAASSNVVPPVAVEPSLTSATEQIADSASSSQTQAQGQPQSQSDESNLVEADRRHHPVHPKPHPHSHVKQNHPHHTGPHHPHHPQHPHGGNHPHRPHHPHDSESLLSDASSSSSASSSVLPPAGLAPALTLAAEQSAEELSDLLAERVELAKLSDMLSAIELQVVDARSQQYKLSSRVAAAQRALKSQEAAADLLLLEQGYHSVAERDTSRYAAEIETMKSKVARESDALHALEEEWQLREKNLNALMLQEADVASDHKLQVEITKKANELYCSNVCKSITLSNCLASTAACDPVTKSKAVDWLNVV